MAAGALRIPYRQRILHYCEQEGVIVPASFDAPKSSDRYALIDVTAEPHRLVNRTTYRESEVIAFLRSPQNHGRIFWILDIKRGLRLSCGEEGKLVRSGTFDCRCPGEMLSLY